MENDLAIFKLSATLGFSCFGGSTLAERLGAALAAETDAASRSICRLLAAEPHAECVYVETIYRSVLVDQRLLSAAR